MSQSISVNSLGNDPAPVDHRQLGRVLRLFHQDPNAPGMVYWHPAGLRVYRNLEAHVRRVLERDRYEEVRSPQLMRRAVWEASGHWAHFKDNMFCLDDEREALKPVSCPAHLSIFNAMAPSYRDLPLRISEFGLVHRDEAGGALQGLLRLRQFCQDDGHILCEEGQVEAELRRFLEGVRPFYAAFGFADVSVGLSLRPDDRAGSDAAWDRGEAVLKRVLDALSWNYVTQPGAGAFYGPKLEFALRDCHGRQWQCGTVQFDLFMPERFNAVYVARDGSKQRPVMLHRALCGSLERFLAIVLEHHAGRLPMWLSPRPAWVVPVSEAQESSAAQLVGELRNAHVFAEVAPPGESLGRRIAQAHELGVGEVAVLGRRELSSDSVAVRNGDGQAIVPRSDWVRSLIARVHQ